MQAEPRDEIDAVHTGRVARLYAATVVFLRYLIVPAWAAACVAVYHYGPTISELPTSDVGALIPAGMPSQRAEEESSRIFGSSLLPRIAVVQRDPNGLSVAQQKRIVRYAVAVDTRERTGYPKGSIAAPYVNSLALFPAARERGTTAITFLAFPSDVSIPRQRDLAAHYARQVSLPNAQAWMTGFIAGNLQQSQTINDHLRWVELVTIALVAAIIGLYLRSLLAPLVTLGAAGIAWVLSTRAVAYLALKTGVSVHEEVEPIIAVLLLGVVTDYSVFFLSGARSRMLDGADRRSATRSTTAEFIPIIFTAGWLVALGLTTLRVASIGFVQTLGPAMAIVVLTSMVVSITFVPAAIALLGRLCFWPGLRQTERSLGQRLRAWVTRVVTYRIAAGLTAILIAVGLAAAGTGMTGTRLALTPISANAASTPAQKGAHEAALGFAGGIVSPTEIVLRKPGITQQRQQLLQLAARLHDVDGVAAAIGAGEAPIPQLRRVFLAPGGDAARYLVVLDHEPYGAAAIDDLGNVREAMPGLLRQSGLEGARVSYAGDTAIAADTVKRIRHDISWVTLTAFAVNFVLLALFLRAVVAPLLLIVASALALAATFGVTTYFFQGFLGYDQLTYYVPLAAGVLLLSFGSDYNLFVVGRIWQVSHRRSVRSAIRLTAPRSSRTISVAGVALALSFAALALVPLQSFREFAFAMAVGVLIDTFLVRSYMIPALIALFGRFSWWPSRRGGETLAAAPDGRVQ